MFTITDEQVEAAFDVLHSNEHAKRRAAYEYGERRIKSVLAELTIKAEGKSATEREAKALASPEYREALVTFKMIAEAYHEYRDKREAAVAVIDAFRTQQSDRRAMRNAA